ncbi:CcdB family protein [Alteriqipengyuania flavescens]|uniref:CcdB family protein n=1 Tax=Alteriqipengyuania flavescens TaxID=3053610 RepID=UPI0025B53B85|nr:CcdB family protein [Alteriqipengyuania flavescens]WJY18083.1 CcdB family protein [Alteriqipengyuania flavescens]WJY24024.1 CcdB family protein [Alteriqipengyuania flavescens]
MARLDVFRLKNGGPLVVDCQAELLEDLKTRVVIPLLPQSEAPKPARNLNPVFEIEDDQFVLMTQFLAAIETSELGKKVGSLERDERAVLNALDFLLTGV